MGGRGCAFVSRPRLGCDEGGGGTVRLACSWASPVCLQFHRRPDRRSHRRPDQAWIRGSQAAVELLRGHRHDPGRLLAAVFRGASIGAGVVILVLTPLLKETHAERRTDRWPPAFVPVEPSRSARGGLKQHRSPQPRGNGGRWPLPLAPVVVYLLFPSCPRAARVSHGRH